MKSIRNIVAATLMTAGVMGASAADPTTSITPPSGAQEWHHHRGEGHLLGQLGLSDQQKVQIKAIMTAAHPEMQNLREQMHANSLTLRNTKPNDPNYASIVSQASQTHGSLSAQAMAQQAQVRSQVFKVLTPAQQTQLAALEAAQAQKHGNRGGHGPESGETTAP
ncbi:MAG TPA: Spy/CpxP family protein refolding chaperone [Steroidobacteraceae bacterium]|jgi:Spy/CpxP family protein refolding chaperone|nr:Spy/CpxP family protein refolding chaperone [Steroidobacteraceae bacterium]